MGGIDSIFGIGGPELFVILVIAGIILGPKRIAQVANWFGRTTAYLQNISRGFANQLKDELNQLDEEGDLKDMMSEMTALRDEVNQLQNQLKGQVQDAVKETKSVVDESIGEVNSIGGPPKLDLNGNGSDQDESSSQNGPEKKAPPQLPNLVEVADDPE